ncbi:Monopolin complex subunit pcs1 [Madurella fahalii]|uniref:Monopolin complex subunit pcs1 n=1 Tax=Madurella fahalii TaxID=1157608 RepID=A0ABQ0GMT1_9PEZI
MPPAKKAATGRRAANRVTKPAPKASTSRHRANNRIAAAAAAAAAEVADGGRTALVDKPSNVTPSGRGRGRKLVAAAEEEEEEEEEDAHMSDAPAPAAETSPAVKKKTARGRPKKAVVEAETRTDTRRGRKTRSKAADAEIEEDVSEIPETQQPDDPQGGVDEGDEDRDDLADLPVHHSSDRAEPSGSSVPVPSSVSKRSPRKPSSDNGDPALRRRLGEMTQKCESLELKYRDLKEIAVREAERNFDRLKKQSEEKSKAADQLIATLKAELAAQKETSKETQRLQKQLETAESKITSLQTKLNELTTSLTDSKSEIKSLNIKLAAARNAEAAATAAAGKVQVPGSAMKGGAGGSSTAASRLAAASTSEAIHQATLAAQKKEDLYGDLTGLIVRSVKREAGEDVFDCIQTGRNGTLHFKLAVEANGGEAQCHYTPQLDSNRDRALIAVLPGFLVDEISFPQTQAGKFYARVMKALNEQGE